ncbi:hypothetical protein QJS04_geneDACA022319 [Acorus gramineus]|uniref:Uncharacterized protein n=1 Tax=Acorus gramineus TaxID=55184 RepID=A0AAV9AHC9_ACOGR|nr:hypothetical protein QJS04_geneDACA022319 [Acorus gramineus]
MASISFGEGDKSVGKGTVEPAPNVDIEGLDIVQECLEEVFKIDQSSGVDLTQPGLLVDLFSSLEANKRSINPTSTSPDVSSTTSAQDTVEPSKSLMDDFCGNSHVSEASKDILFVQFFAGLDKLNFWTTTPSGDDDQVQLAKATSVFDDAFMLKWAQDGNGTREICMSEEESSDHLFFGCPCGTKIWEMMGLALRFRFGKRLKRGD